MARATANPGATAPRHERWYRTVWRWHFYAGLFTIPFILWLSVTGGIYLFKPQIEGWIDRPYDNLAAAGAPAAPSKLVERAEAVVPGSVLHRFVMREGPNDAQRIVVGVGAEETRVYLHPVTGAVLKTVGEEDRLMRVIFRLHGELMAGRWGSTLVELAASWAIVMLLTGLFLWWPRDRAGMGGVLYPRLRRSGRVFWKDLHAVTGVWVSLFAVLLILTGLPWAKNWGDYLALVRETTGQVDGPVDWSRGSDADARERAALDRQSRTALGPHAEHMAAGSVAMDGSRAGELDRVVATASLLGLSAPVEITPPKAGSERWKAQSNVADRPERETVEIDGRTGAVVGRQDFSRHHWIDRLVGYGIAVHEGALFGLANQLLGLLTLVALVTLAISSIVMWWRRRPQGLLGAPPAKGAIRHSAALVAAVIALALLVPLFGLSLALVTLIERTILRKRLSLRRILGLRSA
ncbi:PepSY domain-containing protein [Erythrobacter sp. LQ02-29]|uniref:PepSY-associated TM helix domain-containing protein n=1 Tax=Erythrobacter sp. LQ02-29 TaxID=2920384 RepID=UPI001F4D43D9|nr:PepSY domain-containing protein [Erythrobacter sp. LQ02-29]MCP9222405.1 PepSY domain-containing protein [Erythrobacter sp. LQ02-29]